MISKNQIRFIKSLSVKKIREKSGLYIAEGEKIVAELIASGKDIKHIFATSKWVDENKKKIKSIQAVEISESELKKISSLVTPNEVIAIVQIPKPELNIEEIQNGLNLVLDNIKDPGNLGTIIRIADWFGIKNIICSRDTVDSYNSKVVQSAMGSLTRVKIHYTSLEDIFKGIKGKNKIKIYGALLDGESIYEKKLDNKGFIIIGNESKGISDSLLSFITDKIKIPSYNFSEKAEDTAESLNAAIATAVICAEFRRNHSK